MRSPAGSICSTRTPFRFWSAAVAVALVAPVLALGGSASAAPGQPDTAFGTDGTVGVNLLTVADDDAARAAIAMAGKFVVAGWAGGSGIVVSRLNSDGSLDPTFGKDGSRLIAPSSNSTTRPSYEQFVLLGAATDKIVAGTAKKLIRVGADGALDPTFGTNGVVTLPNPILGGHVNADGSTVIASTAGITRRKVDGSIDTSFATAGTFATTGTPGDLVVDAGGRIIYGNRLSASVEILALTSGGSPDATFDATDSLTFTPVGVVRDVVLDGSDAYALIGTGTRDPGDPVRVVAFSTIGVPDAGFGGGSPVVVDFPGSIDDAFSLAVDGSDRVLVAGASTDSAVTGTLTGHVARLLSNGNLDPSWGLPEGIIDVEVGDQTVVGAALPTGTGVLAFGAVSDDDAPFALEGGGNSFSHGITVLGFEDSDTGTDIHSLVTTKSVDTPTELLPLPDGSTVVVGRAVTSTGRSQPALARISGDGTRDVDFGTDGVTTLPDGVDVIDQAVDGEGRVIVAYQVDENAVLLHRIGADGLIDETYGTDGTARIPFLFGLDGTIVVASGPTNEAVVARTIGNNIIFHALDEDGTVRPDYGNNGRSILGYTSPQVIDGVLDRDGSLLLGANELSGGAPGRAYLLKLGQDGRLAKFGTIGRKFVPDSKTPNGRTEVTAVVVGDDGRAVAIGSYLEPNAPYAAERRFAFQVDVGGEPIVSYGRAGVAIVGVTDGSDLRSAGFDPTGLVHFVEIAGQAGRIRRLDQTGAVDTTFGTGGAVAAAVDRTFAGPFAISADGTRLLASGASKSDISVSAVQGRPRPTAAAFTAVDPARILDTRTGNGAPVGKLTAGTKMRLQVAGRGGVSAAASAVVLTITVTQPDGPGYITAWGGGTRPNSSNVNFGAGQTIPNQAIVPIDSDGTVQLYAQGTTHVIADVAGYFEPVPARRAKAGRFQALTPKRILDTRLPADGAAKVQSGTARRLVVRGVAGVPSSGVSAVVLNVTATQPDNEGFVTVFPAATKRPLASNVNFRAGENAPDHVTVKISPAGTIDLYTSSTTHLIVDVLGYYTDATAPNRAAGLFVPLRPERVLDTRFAIGVDSGFTNRQSAGVNLPVLVSGRGLVPVNDVAGIVLNATVTQTADVGYLTVYPGGVSRPTASNLNFVAADTRANLVSVPVGSDGRVVDFPSRDAHLLFDVFGYYLS